MSDHPPRRRVLTAVVEHPLDRPEALDQTFAAELPADAKFCKALLVAGKSSLVTPSRVAGPPTLTLVFRYQAPWYEGEEVTLETRTFQVSTGAEPLEDGAAYLDAVVQVTPRGVAPILVHEVLPPQNYVAETW